MKDIKSVQMRIRTAKELEKERIKKEAPALYWAMEYHLNSRGERMSFKSVPYLLSLYAAIKVDTQQVVEKSVQCFPEGTRVITPYGYRKIETLQIGDLVLTHKNRYRKVSNVMSRMVKNEPMTKVRSDSSDEVISTREHPYLSYKYVREKYHFTRFDEVFNTAGEWTKAGNLVEGSFLVRPLVPIPNVVQILNVRKYMDREIISSDGTWFKEKWGQKCTLENIDLTYDFGLLCGLYLAEGWINATRLYFGFHYDELELEKAVRKSVSSLLSDRGASIHSYLNRKDTSRRVFVSSYTLSTLFNKLFGDSCTNKQIPDWMLNSNEDFLYGIFHGLFEGDGNATGRQMRFTTVSEELVYQFKFLASMFGYIGTVREEDSECKQTVYRFTSGYDVKYSRAVSISDNQKAVRIKKIESLEYSGIVYNLSVKEDESYVATDYVVHNCGLSELYICNSHVEAAAGLTVMYVLPKYELRNRFVNNRIYKLHKRAPYYAKMTRQGASGIHRTSLMHFGKGTIAYVGSNVESEFIEVPIDSAYVDEKDRCNLANLELLPDRYTASPYKFHREISNPTVEGFGIDARYQESSQGLWHIKCPHCGKWFNPDFFRNVVRQVGPRNYVPRDEWYDPEDQRQEIDLVCECGKPVPDRCMDGEWVHAFPKRLWQGYRISKLMNKFASLRALYDKWQEAQGNETKLQVMYNSELGLPYSSKGAKITSEDLNRLKKVYDINPERNDKPRIVGIDVGADLNYVVREIVKENGVVYLRLLKAGTVPTFEMLGTEVLDYYNPRIAVIDANPEIHKVQELKEKYRNVYSSQFQEGFLKISVDKSERIIKMDRTALLDSVKANVDREVYINPKDAEFLDDGHYYSQMCASTRVLEVDEERPDKSRFVWVHTQPDHYFLTEGYCLQATTLVPNIDDVIDFFTRHTSVLSPVMEGIKDKSPEELKELDRMSKMTPQMALEQIRKMNMKKKS